MRPFALYIHRIVLLCLHSIHFRNRERLLPFVLAIAIIGARSLASSLITCCSEVVSLVAAGLNFLFLGGAAIRKSVPHAVSKVHRAIYNRIV